MQFAQFRALSVRHFFVIVALYGHESLVIDRIGEIFV